MRGWLTFGAVTLTVGLVVYLIGALDRSEEKAAVWEGRVQVADSMRKAAEDKARTDSLTLVRVEQEFRADSVRLASERRRIAQELVRASQSTQEASDNLRATLDLQQGILLDSLDAAHTAELALKDQEVQKADSATAVEHSFRVAAEIALASERSLRLAGESQIGAMQGQIAALQKARRWDRLKGGGVLAAVVAAVVLTR